MHITYIAILLAFLFFTAPLLIWSILMMVNQGRINRGEKKGKPGKRFSQVVPFTGDFQALGAYLHDFLARSGYILQRYGADESIYRCGNGYWLAGRFLKFLPVEGGVLVQAFIIVNGFKEAGVDGFYGFAAKRPLKAMTEQVVGIIHSAQQTHLASMQNIPPQA